MARIALLLPNYSFTDEDGDPLVGGHVYTYIAGTSTPQNTYSDSTGTLNSNPIVLNSLGSCVIYCDPTPSLKLIVTDADDVVLSTQDLISHAEIAV